MNNQGMDLASYHDIKHEFTSIIFFPSYQISSYTFYQDIKHEFSSNIFFPSYQISTLSLPCINKITKNLPKLVINETHLHSLK